MIRLRILLIAACAALARNTESLATLRLVPSQYQTIQAGIDAAVNGDTVLVSDGTYFENISYRGKSIVVASIYLVTGDTSSISSTVIDGSHSEISDSGSVVRIEGHDTTAVLCGFTIRGGTGTILDKADLKGVGKVGGGVFGESARMCHNHVVANLIASDNWTAGGGAYFADLAIIEDNAISYNTATSFHGDAKGGGVYVESGFIRANEITDNSCSTQSQSGRVFGGGLYVGNLDMRIRTVEKNLIAWNRGLALNAGGFSGGGGGIYAARIYTFKNNTVLGNLIEAGNTDLDAIDAYAYGGGVLFQGSSRNEEGVVVSSNFIAQNTVISKSLKDTTGLTDWAKSSGGGLAILNSLPSIDNNIIVRNRALVGGGVSLLQSGTYAGVALELVNNTVAYNRTTGGDGAGMFIAGNWSSPTIVNTIVWGDTGTSEISSSEIRVVYSDIQGGWNDSTDIDFDPQFNGGAYTISDTSPCVGRGIDSIDVGGLSGRVRAPQFDFNGLPRPFPAGSRPDIGACENQGVANGARAWTGSIPREVTLFQNYPNPFNPTTVISGQWPAASVVRLVVYDVLGREVAVLADGRYPAGNYSFTFNAHGNASGVYFYRLTAGPSVATRSMILLK